MQKTILITWWTWYIWSHAVVTFEQAWYKCVIVDNLVNSSTNAINWIEKILGYRPDFFELDLREKDKLEEIFKKYDFDGVIHFAWLKAPFESQEKALYYFQNNISWTINLLEIMNEFNVKNIVFSSSANTYSTLNIPPIKETDIQDTINPYWTTKLLIEKILRDLSKFNSFNVISLRYFNPIWAHFSWFIWEDPSGIPNNLFPFIFKVLTWELSELKVFWDDYDTMDWSWIRDFIDVVDLVESHLLAYKYIENNNMLWFFEAFNVWTWKWLSVLEVIKSVEKILWKKINYSIWTRREGDIPISFCDTSKINKILGFESKLSLEESINNSWLFYNK